MSLSFSSIAAKTTNFGTSKFQLIPLIFILLVALSCFLPGLGNFGMLDPTDSFFIEAAREMMECHRYITVLYNYADWFDKPALSFLLIVISYKIFGISTFAARLPAALSGIILIISTYSFTVRLFGQRVAILAASILCTSPLFLITGHLALSDELLCVFLSIPLLHIGTLLAGDKQRVSLFAYIFLALAILTKGPIALFLTLGTIALYIGITSNSLNLAIKKIRQLRPLAALIILLALCLPYFVLAHSATNGAFTTQFFLHQNLGRFLGVVNHQEPIWFYLPILIGGYFPWCLYFIFSIPWSKSIFARRFSANNTDSMIIFCFCWLACVLVLFTLIPTKLPTYIVPLSTPFTIITSIYLTHLNPSNAIITGIYLTDLSPSNSIISSTHLLKLTPNTLIRLLPPFLVLIASLVVLSFSSKLVHTELPQPGLVICTVLAIAVLTAFCCFSFYYNKNERAIASLVLASIIACSIIVPISFQWFYQTHQANIDKLTAIAKVRDGNLATLFSSVPSAVFRLQKPVPEIQSLSELRQFCQQGKTPHLLLATHNCLKIPELQAKQHIVASDNKWYLLQIDGFPWSDNPKY